MESDEGTPPARSEDAGPGPDPSGRDAPLPDLYLAADRVLARWREQSSSVERGRESELAGHLSTLADAVADARRGVEPSTSTPEGGVVLRRRLLDLLRGELVALWTESHDTRPEAECMAATLAAFEAVQSRQAPRWDEEFGVALAGPSGLELAVEVAHDFRSPLSSVLFLADTLRSGASGELNELQIRQLNLVYSAALSMVSMAGDVIDLGGGGRQAPTREPSRFSVQEVMESIRGMIEPMVDAKGLTLTVRPPDADLRFGYPELLRRVLLNLATNAAKFTSEGFIELNARALEGDLVDFSVRDTGPGIREDSQEDLYRPFRPFQGHSGFHFSGTGLGLTIARKLVRAMEGELEFETQRNLGTRFYFTIELPIVDPV
jgi:signal transduction histidine kinase